MRLTVKKIWIAIFIIAISTILYQQEILSGVLYAIITSFTIVYVLINLVVSGKSNKIDSKYAPLWIQQINGWMINNKNFSGRLFYILLIVLLLVYLVLVIFFKLPVRISG